MQQTKQEIQHLIRKNDKSRKENEKLKDAVDDKYGENLKLDTEHQTWIEDKERMQQMNQGIQDLTITIDELRKDNASLQSTVDDLDGEYFRLEETKRQTLMENTERKQKKEQDLPKTINELRRENEILNREVDEKKIGNLNLKTEIQTWKEDKERVQKMNHGVKDLNHTINQLRMENKSLKSTVDSLDFEYVQLETQRQTWMKKERMQQTKHEVENLNKNINKLRKENEMLNATVGDKIGDYFTLKTELKTLMKNKDRKQQMENEVQDLNRTIDELLKQYKELNYKVHDKNSDILKLQTELQCLMEKKESIQPITQEFQDLNTKVGELLKEKERMKAIVDETKGENYNLKKEIKIITKDNERIQLMKQEIQDLNIKVERLEKETEMLNATVDDKMGENRRLDTERQTMIKERSTVNRTVETLRATNDELRIEIILKQTLIDQAQKALSRSKPLCDLSHSEEELNIRSNMLQHMCRESNEQHEQILKDHAETLYECTGKSKSLQYLTQNFENDFRLQKEEPGVFDSSQDFTKREMTLVDNHEYLSKGFKATSKVKNTYNFFNSSANFHKDCLVEAISATNNTNPSVTND